MDDAYKEVYFHEYCKKCKHEKNPENEEPCFECLNEPENLHSHKPVNWEAKEKGRWKRRFRSLRISATTTVFIRKSVARL